MESYVIGFKIFDARCLQTEDGSPCDPYVRVEVKEEKYETVCLENRDTFAPWNETCIWPSIEMHPKEFDQAIVEFSVFARHTWWRDFLIGTATLQLSFINRRRSHLYARKSLQLYREDSTAIAGMLLVSVFALRPGEQAPTNWQEEEDQGDDLGEDGGFRTGGSIGDLSGAVLRTKVDSDCEGRAHHVQINVHRVEDLAEIASGGLPSPYITVQFAGITIKTDTGDKVKAHQFDTCLQVPVRTPLNEDLIMIRLWTRNWLMPDELLGQGLLSFSDLRSKPLAPRWFPLYGWNLEEVPDPAKLTELGGDLEPNYFKGRLLLSAVVVPLEPGEELQPARALPAMPGIEPSMKKMVLLCDVFKVMGAEGRRCKVELSFGSQGKETKEVSYDAYSVQTHQGDTDEEAEEKTKATEEGINTFSFDQDDGRLEELVVVAPEDPLAQPHVMISVHTEGYLDKFKRIATVNMHLSDFPVYDPEKPSKPRFVALKPMPSAAASRNPPSVLISIDVNHQEGVNRPTRRTVKQAAYVVRAYIFLARHIAVGPDSWQDPEPKKYMVRVACAGMSKTTASAQGPRPLWMHAMDMKVVLCAGSSKEAPTMDPITVTLVAAGQVFDEDVGKATCVYKQVRQKDERGTWKPYKLQPQWVALSGGQYGTKSVGEVLIGFELFQWKYRDEKMLQPRLMYPQPEEVYKKKDHFCRLQKATLHFSLHGLRDILPIFGMQGSRAVMKPFVTVEVSNFAQPPSEGSSKKEKKKEKAENEVLTFRLPGSTTDADGKERKYQKSSDRLKRWSSFCGSMGETVASNFEFLQVGTIRCQIPNGLLLEPYLTIRVWEEPSEWGATFGHKATLIGESRQSLSDLLPCCWLPNVTTEESYEAQVKTIRKTLREIQRAACVKDEFREDEMDHRDSEPFEPNPTRTACAGADWRGNSKDSCDDITVRRRQKTLELLRTDQVDNTGVYIHLRDVQHLRRPLNIQDKDMNMQNERSFSPRKGEQVTLLGIDSSRKAVQGKLEDSAGEAFMHDFYYKNVPLLRNQDIVSKNDSEVDWSFQPGRCFGFIKCTFKLEDGWKAQATQPVAEADAAGSGRKMSLFSEFEDFDVARLRRSFNFPEELNAFAFDEKALREKFKLGVPANVRVRIYLVKAVCVYGKGTSLGDPYIDFQLGPKHHVQMRNMAQVSTNTPEFYRMEERDVELPEDGRLEIRLKDRMDFALSDAVIGATVIDLEDRWHSKEWQKHNERALIPVEHRSLYTQELAGKNRGNIEMWIEMHDSTNTDCPHSILVKPPETEMEIRLVIWSCKGLKMLDEGGDAPYINARVSTQLDCREYNGEHPALQETDVHYSATDGNAVFNWRMVYPRIKMPVTVCNLQVSLHHVGLTTTTFMGNQNMNLRKFLERVAKELESMVIGPNEIELKTADSGEEDSVGSVCMSLYVLTQREADAKRAGIAREEPNDDPQLITPTEGRGWEAVLEPWTFDWPDFSLFKKYGPIIAVAGGFLLSMVFLKLVGIL